MRLLYIKSIMIPPNKLITISQVEKIQKQGFIDSSLKLRLECTKNLPTICATVRTILLDHIPTYSFCKNSINIQKNTSVFDNDYMRKRLSLMCIPVNNYDPKINYLKEKYWVKDNYNFKLENKHKRDNFEFTMIIN